MPALTDDSASASADAAASASSKLEQQQQQEQQPLPSPKLDCDIVVAATAASSPAASIHSLQQSPHEEKPGSVAATTEIPPVSSPASSPASSTVATVKMMMDEDESQGGFSSSSSASASSATSLLQRPQQPGPRSSTSPMLSESDDELDFSTSSECSSNNQVKSNNNNHAATAASSSSSSSNSSSDSSAFAAALASPLPPSPPPAATSFSIAMAYFPPRASQLETHPSADSTEEAASQGRAVEVSPLVVVSESTVTASSVTTSTSASGNAVATRSSPEQQEREEQERRDHAYALELQALLQPELAAAMPIPSPTAHTASRYPAPRADGEYEFKAPLDTVAPTPAAAAAEDWRVRYAKDLELGTQLSNHSRWQENVQGFAEAGAAHFNGGANEDQETSTLAVTEALSASSSSSSSSSSPSGVPVAPALLPSGIARALISQSQQFQRAAERERAQAREFSFQSYQNQRQKVRSGGGGRYAQRGDGSNLDSSDPNSPHYVAPRLVLCGICQEEAPEATTCVFGQQYGIDGSVIQGKKGQCSHAFCKECITAYLSHEITDGQVLKLRCPGRNAADNSPCDCVAPGSWVAKMVGKEMHDKYQRFLQLKLDDSYRSCPKCLHVQQRVGGVAGSDAMECEKCQTVYCFLHDLAHVGGDCRSYKKKLAVESAESLEHIANNTIKCPWPTCRVQCIKSSGCNHMNCARCHTEFCYLCGGFYLGGLHFAPCNLLGCPDMKGDDMPAGSRASWARSFFRVFIGLPLMLTGLFLAIGLFLALEGLYLAWLFGLSPLWIILRVWLWAYDRNRVRIGYYDDKWERRWKKCVGWGVYLIGALLGC